MNPTCKTSRPFFHRFEETQNFFPHAPDGMGYGASNLYSILFGVFGLFIPTVTTRVTTFQRILVGKFIVVLTSDNSLPAKTPSTE